MLNLLTIPDEQLLTPGEVAKLFRVDAKTVGRWSKTGKLPPALYTLGGHRRFLARDLKPYLAGNP